jgi:1,4-dihydroxy-2-naphthoyl-CoA hydrolase
MMEIFKRRLPAEAFTQPQPGTLMAQLGIEMLEQGSDFLRGRMPVDERTRQPMGLLHGGASVALAETLGSHAAYLCLDDPAQAVVGLEINANHLRGVRSGFVYGTARAVHLGRSTQVWEIRIVDEKDQLVCLSRLTMSVLNPKLATPS